LNSCVRVPSYDFSCPIRGPVVNDDLFPILIGLAKNALDARANKPFMVEYGSDDTHQRIGPTIPADS